MDSSSYREKALAGATGVELVLALYDGAIRFLHRAVQCVEEEDAHGRRMAVKKTIDVFMYLQARLRPDIAPSQAAALSDFYTAMFTMTLEASHNASKEQLLDVVACVRNVREAWAVAAKDPVAGRVLPRELRTQEETFVPATTRLEIQSGEAKRSSWSA
jgi:flagellar protein FliS